MVGEKKFLKKLIRKYEEELAVLKKQNHPIEHHILNCYIIIEQLKVRLQEVAG